MNKLRRALRLPILALLPCCAAQSLVGAERTAAAQFHFPTTGQSVAGEAILLAIDEMAWPLRGNLCYFMTKPSVRQAPVLAPSQDKPDAPDNMATHLYGTVLFDEGRFRMWYYAVHFTPAKDNLVQGPICYAESTDGVKWTKPNLGLVEYRGNRNNNIVDLPGDVIEGVQVIKDVVDPDPQRRYKLIYNVSHPKYHFTMRPATSADGLHWKIGPEGVVQNFMEFASMYQHGGLYIINAQIWNRAEGGRAEGRQAYAWVSTDFDHWIQQPGLSFALSTPEQKSGYFGKYDQLHLGIGAQSFGNVAIGLYARWHERGWGIGGTSADFGLVLSQDGLHFYEPVRDYTFISQAESPVTPVAGKSYPTILTQTNSILNFRDETRIYFGRWRNAPDYPAPGAEDYSGEVALATLPRDRWGAMGLFPTVTEGFEPVQEQATHAAEDGAAWSMPVTLPTELATSVWLNADATAGIRVDLADEKFNLLPEYSGNNCGVTSKPSGLDCRVEWPRQSMDPLRGKTVRVRVRLANDGKTVTPRLYAVYLRAK